MGTHLSYHTITWMINPRSKKNKTPSTTRRVVAFFTTWWRWQGLRTWKQPLRYGFIRPTSATKQTLLHTTTCSSLLFLKHYLCALGTRFQYWVRNRVGEWGITQDTAFRCNLLGTKKNSIHTLFLEHVSASYSKCGSALNSPAFFCFKKCGAVLYLVTIFIAIRGLVASHRLLHLLGGRCDRLP